MNGLVLLCPLNVRTAPDLTQHALTQNLGLLKGVGPKLIERLGDMGLHTVEDVLFHFPLRYQDRTRVTPIAGLQDGLDAVVSGEIRMANVVPGRRRALLLKVDDGTGILTVRFFHFRHAQVQQLKAGRSITVFGQPRWSASGADMVHPEYRLDSGQQLIEPALTPLYPTVEGIGQSIWRKLTDQALALLSQSPPEDLLYDLQHPFNLVDALCYLHRPPASAPVAEIRDWQHPAQRRLALEELIAHQLSLQLLRAEEKSYRAPVIQDRASRVPSFLKSLPFEPTKAQQRVSTEIAQDMMASSPMLRLVQGDVGSGKTLVAAIAALRVIDAGYQVVLMAPTELLAEQHLRNFNNWFGPLSINISWLSGKVKGKARVDVLSTIASGAAQLVIGTHALFQEGVEFKSLALVMVDEQHRFGVHQRLALTQKSGDNAMPHQLVLTATPIPRTLSMLAYADLDCSVIDELPPGRTPIKTSLVDNNRREEVIQRVAQACREGRQAYWVCTLIEESDHLNAQAAEVVAEQLQMAMPDTNVGLIHGRLSSNDKELVMNRFKAGELALLVATTVIEVGVDVPNASLMIIENPERLGLAQLHQLRGRVGRGATASFCLLLYQAPLSQNSRARLNVMRESNDGFFIAEEDLRLRGPGELLGTRQTGMMTFRVAQLPEHDDLLDQASEIAARIVNEGGDRMAQLVQRWTADRQAFARV